MNERPKKDDTDVIAALKRSMRESPTAAVVTIVHAWNEDAGTSSGNVIMSPNADAVTLVAVSDNLLRMATDRLLESAKQCASSREVLRSVTAARAALGFEQPTGKPS